MEEFCNTTSNTLTLLKSVTTILTGGNILLNRDAGTPEGVGSVLTFPSIEGFADRLLGPSECVTVTYKIGLATSAEFQFFVDVLGDIVEPSGNVKHRGAEDHRGNSEQAGEPAKRPTIHQVSSREIIASHVRWSATSETIGGRHVG